ncbi:hypothetical protein BG004_003916, partial [Podila humilis]
MSRDPTRVESRSNSIHSMPTPVMPSSSSSYTSGADEGLSKIKATAMLLKAKVAGSVQKEQKKPNKILNPYAAVSAPSSSSSPSTSSTSSATSSVSSLGGLKKESIKNMIAAREDPSLSCNKLPQPGAQRRDAVKKSYLDHSQKHYTSSPSSTSTSSFTQLSHQPDKLPKQVVTLDSTSSVEGINKRSSRRRNAGTSLIPSQFSTTMGVSQDAYFESSGFVPPQSSSSSGPTTTVEIKESSKPSEDKVVAASSTTTTTTTAGVAPSSCIEARKGVSSSAGQVESSNKEVSPHSSSCQPAPKILTQQQQQKAEEETEDDEEGQQVLSPATPTPTPAPAPVPCPLSLDQTKKLTRSGEETCSDAQAASLLSSSTTITKQCSPNSVAAIKVDISTMSPSTPKTSKSVFDRPAMSPRRHTTSSPSSSGIGRGSSLYTFHLPFDSPPLPLLTKTTDAPSSYSSSQKPPMSVINPTLRQLQTPHIPVNLVQARIQQQEEERRRKEELAKIPITANLRSVKKIQAILLSDDEDGDDVGDSKTRRAREASSSSASSSTSNSSLSVPGSGHGLTRPRAKTASYYGSQGYGGKQRGDRNHVEPVAIPKKLADQVEHILGRKIAGKGCLLDEREKEREEEEARKAATPLPPIVLGQPRKRAMTSEHIRNLVSSWDIKVEEAKEVISEAEKIKQFLEQRSTAHAALPKGKVPVTASELLAPLPSLPPPPPLTQAATTTPLTGASHGLRRHGRRRGESYSVDLSKKSGNQSTAKRPIRPLLKETRSASSTQMTVGDMIIEDTDANDSGSASGYASGPELTKTISAES